MFAAAIPFNPNPFLEAKMEITRVESLMELNSNGRLLALPVNIRRSGSELGWQTLPYYNTGTIAAVISFIVQAPQGLNLQLATKALYERTLG